MKRGLRSNQIYEISAVALLENFANAMILEKNFLELMIIQLKEDLFVGRRKSIEC